MAMKDSNGEPIEATVEEFNRLYDKAWAESHGVAVEGDDSEAEDIMEESSNFSKEDLEEETIVEEDLEVETSGSRRLLTRTSHGLGFLLKYFW